jgi:hypothetical protein
MAISEPKALLSLQYSLRVSSSPAGARTGPRLGRCLCRNSLVRTQTCLAQELVITSRLDDGGIIVPTVCESMLFQIRMQKIGYQASRKLDTRTESHGAEADYEAPG